jgi:hypothetical protein
MLKFYLNTVLIYFIIFVSSGILFKKDFIKARDKIRKELNDNSKIQGNAQTTFNYLLVSCIPFIRLISLLIKFWLMINPDEYIKIAKKNQKKEGKEENE